MKFVTRFVLLTLGLMALVGCMQVFPTVQVSELPTPTPTEVEQVLELPEQPTEVIDEGLSTTLPPEETAPTDAPTAVSEPDATLAPTEAISGTLTVVPPTEAPTESTALGSTELRATNPANVNLASGKVQLVEFFAFWGHVCRSMAPIVHGLEDKYKGQINFVYLDIDDDNTQKFKDALEYYYQPHLFLLDAEGNIIQQWIGYVQQAELEAALVSATQGGIFLNTKLIKREARRLGRKKLCNLWEALRALRV